VLQLRKRNVVAIDSMEAAEHEPVTGERVNRVRANPLREAMKLRLTAGVHIARGRERVVRVVRVVRGSLGVAAHADAELPIGATGGKAESADLRERRSLCHVGGLRGWRADRGLEHGARHPSVSTLNQGR